MSPARTGSAGPVGVRASATPVVAPESQDTRTVAQFGVYRLLPCSGSRPPVPEVAHLTYVTTCELRPRTARRRVRGPHEVVRFGPVNRLKAVQPTALQTSGERHFPVQKIQPA